MFRRTLLAAAGAALVALMMPAVPVSAGGFCHSDSTDATGTAVEMKDACFTPTVLHVKLGQAITWVNRDGFAHMVIGAGGTWGGFDELAGGDSVTYRFGAPGVYPYFCVLHPGMIGAVVVGDGTAPGKAASISVADLQVPSPNAAGGAGSDPAPVGALAGGAALGAGVAAAVTLLLRRRGRRTPAA
jgi:plastocyanin